MSVLSKLFSRRGSTSLERMRAADLALGSPSKSFPAVHVAGTNGKGSVATKIAKALELSGKRVGLFTSPHILRYEERIQINGVPITHSEERLKCLLDFNLTFFETMTLLAFETFRDVDIAVLEVGLGGRLDATNLCKSVLSVITSIDLDHTEVLGETREEIAFEKAGIIREGVPVVLGEGAQLKPMWAKKSPLIFVPTSDSTDIARAAVKQLKVPERGLDMAPPYRFEVRGDLILDGAHNPAAIEWLLKKLDERFPGRERSFGLWVRECKDRKKIADLLVDEEVYWLKDELAIEEFLAKRGLKIICGSFYIFREVENVLKLRGNVVRRPAILQEEAEC